MAQHKYIAQLEQQCKENMGWEYKYTLLLDRVLFYEEQIDEFERLLGKLKRELRMKCLQCQQAPKPPIILAEV
jgi:hypothetical protein